MDRRREGGMVGWWARERRVLYGVTSPTGVHAAASTAPRQVVS